MAPETTSAYLQLKDFVLSILRKNLPSEDGAALDAIIEKIENRELKHGESEALSNYVTSRIKLNHDKRHERSDKFLAALQSRRFISSLVWL